MRTFGTRRYELVERITDEGRGQPADSDSGKRMGEG